MPEAATEWSEDRIQVLTKMWNDGRSAAEIMRALGGGTTRSAVIGKVHRLKLLKRPNAVRERTVPVKVRRTPDQVAEDSRVRATVLQRNRNAGQPKAAAIRHRVATQSLPPAPMPRMDEGADRTQLLDLFQLTDRTCKWPIGDPVEPDFGFCGAAKLLDGGPYCSHHAKRAYHQH